MFIAREVQLRGEQLVTWCMNFEVQVRWTPGVPTGCCNELATGAIGWDLVRGRANGMYFKFAVCVDHPGTAQVPFWDARGKLGVETIAVGVPQFNTGILQRGAIGRTDLAGEFQWR